MPDVNLRDVAVHFQDKLKPIKVCLFDVDGVLTDGRIFFSGEEVGFNRFFHALDGYGLKILKEAGIKVGFISGGDSLSIRKRSDYLKLDYLYVGTEDKRQAFLSVMKDAGVQANEILFMGDEFFDIPLMKKAGFSATVPLSSHEVKEAATYVTSRDGGKGAVREVIDILRYAQGWSPRVPEF